MIGDFKEFGFNDRVLVGDEGAVQTAFSVNGHRAVDGEGLVLVEGQADGGLEGEDFPVGDSEGAVHLQEIGAAGSGRARLEDDLPHRTAAQVGVDGRRGLGHGQGNGLRGRGCGAAAATTAAAAAVGVRGSGNGVGYGIGPHGFHGNLVLLLLQLFLDFLQLIPDQLLVLLQLLRRFHRRVPQVQAGFFVNLVAEGFVGGQLHQDEPVDVRDSKFLPDNFAFTAGAVLGVDGADGHLAGGDIFRLGLPGHGVCDRHGHCPLQNINLTGPLVDDLYPSARPPYADAHGGGADIQVFIALQVLVHLEEQVAGIHQDVQLPVLFPDADLRDGVHFHHLHVVQVNPRITLFLCLQLVAAAQRHALCLGHGPPAAVGDADGPLCFHQPHGRGHG